MPGNRNKHLPRKIASRVKKADVGPPRIGASAHPEESLIAHLVALAEPFMYGRQAARG